MTEALIDNAIVTEAQSVMKAKFPTMISYFFEDSEGYVGNISSAFDTNDISKVIAPAHTIKSSARQIGALKLSEIAKMMELSARDYKGSELENDLIKDLFIKLKNVLIDTKKAFEKLGL